MARNFNAPRRMDKIWEGIGESSLTLTASGTFVGGSFFTLVPITVMRIMGEYLLQFAVGGTIVAGDLARITLAIGRVSTDAAALGASAMPDPEDEEGYPWLFWKSHVLSALTADPVQVQDGIGYVRQQFDVRSQRKLKPGESLAWVI